MTTNIVVTIVTMVVTNWAEVNTETVQWKAWEPVGYMSINGCGNMFLSDEPFRTARVTRKTVMRFDWAGVKHEHVLKSEQIATLTQHGKRKESVEWGPIERTLVIDITENITSNIMFKADIELPWYSDLTQRLDRIEHDLKRNKVIPVRCATCGKALEWAWNDTKDPDNLNKRYCGVHCWMTRTNKTDQPEGRE